MLLDSIQTPHDLRHLDFDQLRSLAEEVRKTIVETVATRAAQEAELAAQETAERERAERAAAVLLERYPDAQVVLTHGFDWMRFLDGKKLSIPKEVYEAAPCDHPNFFVQFLPAVFLGKVYDYPMLEMKPTLEDMVRYIGIDRLLWGTDIPILMRYTTYLQSLDQIRFHCEDIFGVEGLDRVMGENMGRLMGLT